MLRHYYASIVAPFVGAWIEIGKMAQQSVDEIQSLRSSERGLKLHNVVVNFHKSYVAPFVGAWIEIPRLNLGWETKTVAPFVGAWIEI